MRRKRVLIIDDEPNFTQMVKFNLEETGDYEVRMENEAAASVATARVFHPDVILLDVVMPQMEGPDVVYYLRQENDMKDIPVIFLTATITREEVELQHGMIAGHTFLAKPTNLAELIDCIERKCAPVFKNSILI